jgi:hypothetical protein
VTLNQALVRNSGTCRPDAKGEAQADGLREGESTERDTGAELFVVGLKVLQWGWTEGAASSGLISWAT